MPRVARRLQGLEPLRPEATAICNPMADCAAAAMPPSVLGLPIEIWALVADQIMDKRTLQALVSTCRSFRDIFTPALNSQRVIRLHERSPTEWLADSLPANIEYTKDFQVMVHEFMRGYEEDMNDDYASHVSRMVKAMPRLRSFLWDDCAAQTGYGPSLMLRNAELLKGLKTCSTLRHLSIQFAGQHLEEGAERCLIDLDGFKNLTSLELYHFHSDDEWQLIKGITNTLYECPNLKKLGLGRAHEFITDLPTPILFAYSHNEFLEKLCLYYGSSRDVARPLKLETLRLGEGLFLVESGGECENYLAKLVDLGSLQTLHIWNGLIMDPGVEFDAMALEVDWSLLNDCTSLRHLEVTGLEDNLRKWLNKNGTFVQELVLLEPLIVNDYNIRNLDRLKLPNLKTLFMLENGYSSDVFSITDDKSESESETDGDPILWVENLPDPKSSVPATLNAMGVCVLSNSIKSVLDRLHDHGSQLERLALSLDLETQWEQFSSHLPKMKNLRYLRLDKRCWYPGLYPRPECSIWPTVTSPKEIATRFVKLMKWKCPSLQYIKVGDCAWAWEILPTDVASLSETEIYTKIELRQLSFDEVNSIPLFGTDILHSQSGLSCPERGTEKDVKETEEWRIKMEGKDIGNMGSDDDEDEDEDEDEWAGNPIVAAFRRHLEETFGGDDESDSSSDDESDEEPSDEDEEEDEDEWEDENEDEEDSDEEFPELVAI